MYDWTKKQKDLLKGIAELSGAIWTLDHADTFTPNDHNRLVTLRRAANALSKDAIQAAKHFERRQAKAWLDLVALARTCCTSDQAAAYSRALELRFDPLPQEVVIQPTLWGDES